MLLLSAYRKTGWGLSLLFHLVLFLILALAGFFSRTYNAQQSEPTNVVYVANSNGGSSAAGGSDAGGAQSAASADDIILSDKAAEELGQETSGLQDTTNPKPITDGTSNAVSHPQAQTASKQANSTGTGSGTSTDTGTGSGTGSSGSGSGSGMGLGSGAGTGTGSGSGTGSGTGSGSGSGSGDGAGDGAGSDLVATVPPSPLNAPYPSYPDSMRSSGDEGFVQVRFTVGAGGDVQSVAVVSSSGQQAFEDAALSAASQWSFSPAYNAHGQPVACMISQTFRFSLN